MDKKKTGELIDYRYYHRNDRKGHSPISYEAVFRRPVSGISDDSGIPGQFCDSSSGLLWDDYGKKRY